MKLVNFYDDGELQSLRKRMGAELVFDLSLRAKVIESLSVEELEELTSGGLERNFSDCKVEPDGTLSFRGKRVIVYIHDRHMYGDDWALPRFHLAYCRTLRDQHNRDSYNQKYVISQRDDGQFSLRIFRNGLKEETFKRLDVCQNCLALLEWNGYRLRGIDQTTKRGIVESFNLQEFFQRYPKDILSALPRYNSDTVPINDYPSNWSQIRASLFERRGYKCEECGSTEKGLEVHHVNHIRSNNEDYNLEILCHRCHKAHHSHYK